MKNIGCRRYCEAVPIASTFTRTSRVSPHMHTLTATRRRASFGCRPSAWRVITVLRAPELRDSERLVEEHADEFLREWEAFHGETGGAEHDAASRRSSVAISRRFSRTPESDKPPLDARSGDRRQSHSQRLVLRSHDARRRLLPPLRSSAFSQCLPLSVAASRMSSLSNRSRAATSDLRPHRPLRRPPRSLFSAVVRQGRRPARKQGWIEGSRL